MNRTGISQFNQARIEWAIRLRYSPIPEIDMEKMVRQLNEFRIGELRTVGKTWELMMERDGELAINSEKRKADSATLDWQIATDGSLDGDKHAAALQYFYNNLTATKALDQDATGGVDELIFQVLSALDYYYSAHEILLRADNPAAKEVTAEFRHTPVWFLEARRGYLGYLKHIFDLYGQPCIAGEWLTAVNSGWMRPLSVAYVAKWLSMEDWMTFCRRYGSGFLEGITEATKDSTEWNEAAEALEKLANDATVLHNKSLQFKFLEHPARNQLPFQPMAELVDRLYAKCYRGVDLATGSRGTSAQGRGSGVGGGSNPVGASVQREESGILLVRDAKWVTGVFNDRIDRPIIRYLFNEEPRAWFSLMPPLNDTTMEDLQSLRTLVPMGLRIALKEVYQRFRWSVPAAGEPCLSAGPMSNVQSPMSGNANAEGRMQNEEGGGGPQMRSAEGGVRNGERAQNAEGEVKNTPNSGIRTPNLNGKTLAAQTTDNTPIAAGADPARNPGLVAAVYDRRTNDRRINLDPNSIERRSQNAATTASRQMPDTQVDASDFWSRVGLAPRGADGQTLPMPSLGYAVPNAVPQVAETETLNDRLKDLTARGLGHCRAAQALQSEISRRIALNNQSSTLNQIALPNYDPDERRDRDGKWTTGGNAGSSGTNSPNATKTAASAAPSAKYKPTPYEQTVVRTGITDPENESFEQWLTPEKQAYYEQLMRPTLRPMTWSEKLGFDLRQLMFKWLPGTRPSGQPSPGQVIGAASMLLPFGVGPETRLGKLLLGYFMAKTASEQPTYIRAIQQELQTGNYSDASRHAVEDALKITMIGAGIHGATAGEGPKGPEVGKIPEEPSESGAPPQETKPNSTETDQQQRGEQAGPTKEVTTPPENAGGEIPSLRGNVPDPVKWIKNGGKISYAPDGFTYTLPNGISVKYDNLGFPDFSPYLYKGGGGRNQVRIKLTGDRDLDVRAANAAAGFKGTPVGYIWHHNEELGLMQLVEKDVHSVFWHTGGFSLNNQ